VKPNPTLLACGLLAAGLQVAAAESASSLALPRLANAKPRNIVLILTDDHRFDAMGFAGHPFLKTPHMDALARGGAHLRNAFVTTSLCSPSRASILTGLYMHRHGVVDNNHPVRAGLVFFPQHLQAAGYDTAFVGKWHMGSESDAPQPGFHHWVSFKGQGTYWPNPNGLNVNGRRVPQKGYLTDELTEYALQWLEGRSAEKPFLLYLSHKAVHTDFLPTGKPEGRLLVPGIEGQIGFVPAPRHQGRYASEPFVEPESLAFTPRNFAGQPMWVQNRRNSRHGVDVPFGNPTPLVTLYRQYMETLLAVDESIGRVLEVLRRKSVLESTLVIYMGDNGYAWGEHGMTDKRTAYEESIRIPLVMQCPELIRPGTRISEMVANIDLAPTILEAAGLEGPRSVDGRSFLPLLRGETIPWRDELLYEYYWEWNYPQTPTLHALRTNRFKFIRPHGVWDIEELYDLEKDPHEITNLIRQPEHASRVKEMRASLFRILKETGGLAMPLFEDRDAQMHRRLKSGTPQAAFPEHLIQR
jgi:N-acetylglucosamine-6-sulfatase